MQQTQQTKRPETTQNVQRTFVRSHLQSHQSHYTDLLQSHDPWRYGLVTLARLCINNTVLAANVTGRPACAAIFSGDLT